MDREVVLKEKIGDARKKLHDKKSDRASKINELETLLNRDNPPQKKISALQNDISDLKNEIISAENKHNALVDDLLGVQSHTGNHTLTNENDFMFDHPSNDRNGSNGRNNKKHWIDNNGNKIRIVNSGENFTKRDPDISLGELASAMITGKGRADVKNALSEGTDSAGGFTVPSATLENFFDKMRSKSRVVQAGARTIKLDTDSTTIARIVSDPTASWHVENASISDSDLTFEGAEFQAKTLVSLVKASRELVQDSLNIEEVIEAAFIGVISAELDRAMFFGTGSGGEMKGITQYSGISTTTLGSGNGGALTNYDPLVTAYRKLLDENSSAPTAYLMSPREWEALATLKDSDNRYLDKPQAITEIPFMETTNIPITDAIGTSNDASRIITGNFNDLVIGLRSEMRVELLKESFAQNYQYGFLVHMRVDAIPAREKSFSEVTGITPA